MALHNLDEQKKKVEALKQKHQEEYKKTRTALRAVAHDTNFQIVMRHMAKICGFFQSSVVVDPNTNRVNMESMVFNEGRRAVYLDLRRMMTDDVRRIVESKGEESTNDEQKGES